MKVRMIQDMTASYNMTWKKIDIHKYDNVDPIELTATELKAVVTTIKKVKSVHQQRQIITELLLYCTDDSFRLLCSMIGEELLEKIMPEC